MLFTFQPAHSHSLQQATHIKLGHTTFNMLFLFLRSLGFFKVHGGHIQVLTDCLKGPQANQSDSPPLLIPDSAIGEGKEINESK